MKPQRLAAIIALLAVLALGIAFGPFVFPQVSQLQKFRPKFGLDIQGGARVVLEADTTKLPKGKEWNQDTKSAVLHILTQRVNANGVAEAVITPKGTNQFVVELPAVRNEQQILDQLQNTAQLQFFYSPDWVTNRNKLGRYAIAPAPDNNGKRESFEIRDTTTQKTFRDRFHISLALGELVGKAATAAGTGLTEVTIPDNLESLSGAQGHKTLFLTADQQKELNALADELTQFDSFLSQAQLIMDGSDLMTARSGFDQGGGSKGVVNLEFNASGKDKFADFTRNHTQEILMIYLDGRILMAPNINEPILNGSAQISPFETLVEAQELANYLNGGALPVPLKIDQQQSVEATLGTQAVHQGLTAGIIGLAAVIAFMMVYYLLPGTIACFALVLYTLFTYAAFLLAGVTFTLPGIAGFILSVGMAVDANILIFERTKEELRDGRPLRSAIQSGFQRAFSAILDSNVCTAFTSICLYQFGTGPVRGFALTLLIGVAISMFTAITVTRTFLLLLVGDSQTSKANLSAWGVNRTWAPKYDMVKNRVFFYALSLAVIIPGLIFAGIGGFKQGIDFTGGTEIRLHFPPSVAVTRESVESAVKAQGYEDSAAQIAGDNTVYLRIPPQKGVDVSRPQTQDLVNKLQGAFPGVTEEEYSSVGGAISGELKRGAGLAIGSASLFIILYLAFRFAGNGGFVSGLKYGIAAIIAMLHDVLVLVGVFSILGYFLNWKVDSLFVTGALTVIGFSVHDTIVIFDRIRENLGGRGGRDTFAHVVARSINETFSRSINTSFTVVLTLLALLIFGGPVIRPLNAALLIGIISGTYSSIFNAAPLVVDWQRRFGKGEIGDAPGPGGTPRPSAPASSPRETARPVTPSTPTPRTGGASTDVPRPSTNYGGSSAPPLPPGPKPRKRRM